MPAARSRWSSTASTASSASRRRPRSPGRALWLAEHPADARERGQAGRGLAERLTWDTVVEALLSVKVAYDSPLPPERSGIADYSGLLLPALQRRADVVAVRRGSRRLPRGVDVAVYHIGNNPDAHGWIFELMRRHAEPRAGRSSSCTSSSCTTSSAVSRSGAATPRRTESALQAEAGAVGRLLGHAVVDGLIPAALGGARPGLPAGDAGARPGRSRRRPFALRRRAGSRAHASAGRCGGFRCRSGQIPRRPRTPQWLPRRRQSSSARSATSTPRNASRSSSPPSPTCGVTAPTPCSCSRAPCRAGLELEPLLARHRLERGRDVVLIDHVSEERLWALLSAFDVSVSLRAPTMGETSAMALRALAVGRPLVVSDLGWFAELPDAVAAKVPVDERRERRCWTRPASSAGGRRRAARRDGRCRA